MKQPIRSLVSASVLMVLANSAFSGSFSLYTESAGYTIGNYAAGAAAEANDASTGWYNPAGLVLLDSRQFVFGAVEVMPRSSLSGDSHFRTVTPSGTLLQYNQGIVGLQGADSGFVPSFHYAHPWNDRLTLGLSVVAPFGLATDWGTASPVRYAATYTQLLTTDVSPEFGYKLTDTFFIGAGLDIEYARVKFNRVVGTPATAQFFPGNPFFSDTLSNNTGDSWGVGAHVGLMKTFNDNQTRFGINYQSQVHHKFSGKSIFRGRFADSPTGVNPDAVFRNDDLTSNGIELPDVVALSAFHRLNNTIDVLGSVVYTHWSTIQTIQLNGVAAVSVETGAFEHALVTSTSELNYRDAWRVALGVNYHVNDDLMFRAGGGIDKTPTRDEFRDIRVPDANRAAVSVGAHYQYRPNIGLDIGYTHLFAIEHVLINKTEITGPGSTYNISASGNARADLIGLQVVWALDQPMPMPTK